MRKYLLEFAVFVLAFGIFSVSALRAASVSRGFTTTVPTTKPVISPSPVVNYAVAYTGKILPDSPVWSLKALRDRLWYATTFNPLKKAELALLFSDKRLMAAKLLLEMHKPDLAVSTYIKGEKYLEIAARQEQLARQKGENTNDFLVKLANASLKHRQFTEDELLPLAPEDARPEIIKTEVYAKTTYNTAREVLISKGIESPKGPFKGQ